MDVDGVEVLSPLLAEAQLIDVCVISAVYFSTTQGTAPVHPTLPTCKAKANEGVFAAEEPSHTPRIIRFSV